jgi:hypothetical protein
MRGAITPLPNMPSWRGAQLKKKLNKQDELSKNMNFNVFYQPVQGYMDK